MSEQITYERIQNTLILHLPPEIDHHSSKEIKERTEAYLRECCIRHIVFDFSRTTFMDSSGIGALLGRYKRMREKGGSVQICNADERICRILRISGVDKLIPIPNSGQDGGRGIPGGNVAGERSIRGTGLDRR